MKIRSTSPTSSAKRSWWPDSPARLETRSIAAAMSEPFAVLLTRSLRPSVRARPRDEKKPEARDERGVIEPSAVLRMSSPGLPRCDMDMLRAESEAVRSSSPASSYSSPCESRLRLSPGILPLDTRDERTSSAAVAASRARGSCRLCDVAAAPWASASSSESSACRSEPSDRPSSTSSASPCEDIAVELSLAVDEGAASPSRGLRLKASCLASGSAPAVKLIVALPPPARAAASFIFCRRCLSAASCCSFAVFSCFSIAALRSAILRSRSSLALRLSSAAYSIRSLSR
mmetsp:Transcript_21874/g.44180  ORF Transcript_21874/g.44180 Transcript_21874/m.44180 type:complete len:288 (+) Transcript_21874:1763-2626(+)